MRKQISTLEQYLHKVWKAQAFEGKLKTKEGEDIEVFSPGEENLDKSGPDFLNAKIRIGSLVFVGDVEIDASYNGWKQHGHNIDGHYNKTILHVIFENKQNHSYVYTKGGRKVPILQVDKIISKDYLNAIKNQELPEEKSIKLKIRCEENVLTTDYFLRERFVAKLGAAKFEAKIEKMFHRLKELKFLEENKIEEPKINFSLTPEYENAGFSDFDFRNKELWQQLFYEFLFEALGYTQNKHSMLKLSRLAELSFLKKIGRDENYLEKIQAVLFRISGLLTTPIETEDNEMNEFQNRLSAYWNELKTLYDSEYLDETDWHFFRMRPQNFPTVRIAAGAYFIDKILNGNLISELVDLIKSTKSNKKIISEIRNAFVLKSFSVWKNHYVFYKKSKSEIRYLVGLSRADEIIVNVLLPFLALYFKVFQLNDYYKRVLKLFTIYEQKSEYTIVSEIAPILGLQNLTHRTLFIHGILHLYRSYCSKGKCSECEIGKVVFE